MKILVAVKRALDYNLKPRIASDGKSVDLANMKMSMNPFDEIAVEEAVSLKEKNIATEITAVTIGEAKAQDILRSALARGADKAILVESDINPEPLVVAKTIKAIVERDGYDMVILGKQAIDNDCNQTGQMLSALLSWPQACFVSKLDVDGDIVTVDREVDGGIETVELHKPCVITTDLRLNEPRYLSPINIIKAKSKPLEKANLSDFGIDNTPRLELLNVEEPEARKAGIIVNNVAELVDKLQNDAKVL